MPLTYHSGDEIRAGDRATCAGEAGRIEFVVENSTGDPEKDWLFENYGAGARLNKCIALLDDGTS